jgi:hypothetical protein
MALAATTGRPDASASMVAMLCSSAMDGIANTVARVSALRRNSVET